jgi:hypothetical protein
MLDWPGLASREMVEARKQLGPIKEFAVYGVLKPDWMVWRPMEARSLGAGAKDLYEVVQVFDASDQVRAVRWLPGRGYLWCDQAFLIFHRKPDSNPGPAN